MATLRRICGQAGLAACALLAACTTLPDFAATDYVKVESLFYTVEQELCAALAVAKSDPKVSAKLGEAGISIERQFAKATAGLKLVKVLDASGNAAFVIPVTHGTISVGLNAGRQHVNTVDTSVSVYYPFAELECVIANPPPLIAGGLGLTDWVLNTTVALINVRETPAAYSYEVSFSVTADGRARPSFELVTSGFDSIGGGASLGAARELTHTLSITIKDVAVEERARDGKGTPGAIRDALDREESLTILRRIRE